MKKKYLGYVSQLIKVIVYGSFTFDSFPVTLEIYLSSCSHTVEYFEGGGSNSTTRDYVDDFFLVFICWRWKQGPYAVPELPG